MNRMRRLGRFAKNTAGKLTPRALPRTTRPNHQRFGLCAILLGSHRDRKLLACASCVSLHFFPSLCIIHFFLPADSSLNRCIRNVIICKRFFCEFLAHEGAFHAPVAQKPTLVAQLQQFRQYLIPFFYELESISGALKHNKTVKLPGGSAIKHGFGSGPPTLTTRKH